MVLTGSTAVKFSNIQSEFGGSGEIKMSEYYTGAGNISLGVGTQFIPYSGNPIKVSDLRGKWKNFDPLRYPPAALTGATTVLSSQSYGNGTYECTTSYNYDNALTPGYKAFDRNEGDWATGWSCVGKYSSSSGAYTGTTSTTATNGGVYNGEYIQLKLPLNVKLCKFGFLPRNDFTPYGYVSRLPRHFDILASVNGTTWDHQMNYADVQYSSTNLVLQSLYLYGLYPYIRFVIRAVGNTNEINRDGADIAELYLYFADS